MRTVEPGPGPPAADMAENEAEEGKRGSAGNCTCDPARLIEGVPLAAPSPPNENDVALPTYPDAEAAPEAESKGPANNGCGPAPEAAAVAAADDDDNEAAGPK